MGVVEAKEASVLRRQIQPRDGARHEELGQFTTQVGSIYVFYVNVYILKKNQINACEQGKD